MKRWQLKEQGRHLLTRIRFRNACWGACINPATAGAVWQCSSALTHWVAGTCSLPSALAKLQVPHLASKSEPNAGPPHRSVLALAEYSVLSTRLSSSLHTFTVVSDTPLGNSTTSSLPPPLAIGQAWFMTAPPGCHFKPRRPHDAMQKLEMTRRPKEQRASITS